MKTNKKSVDKIPARVGANFFDHFWEKSWIYIKTVVDVVREPVLILDKDLRVISANEAFYETFLVKPKGTENKIVYQLGDGQWDIPALHKLLDDILLNNTFFKGFQVAHEFPGLGRKVMILNGRQIYISDKVAKNIHPPVILLAIEDVTAMMVVAESVASQAKQIETKLTARSHELETHIRMLEKEIEKLKRKQ
jgi:nitrogen-specific signal transduction histidine kinase